MKLPKHVKSRRSWDLHCGMDKIFFFLEWNKIGNCFSANREGHGTQMGCSAPEIILHVCKIHVPWLLRMFGKHAIFQMLSVLCRELGNVLSQPLAFPFHNWLPCLFLLSLLKQRQSSPYCEIFLIHNAEHNKYYMCTFILSHDQWCRIFGSLLYDLCCLSP